MTFILFVLFLAGMVWLMRRGNTARELRRRYVRNGVAKQLPKSKVVRRVSDYL